MKISEELAPVLLDWYEQNKRSLPWRKDRDPYHIWISEIMCQQTRAEAVKGYYNRFLDSLPTITALAECPQDSLNKLWEGLGYYSRARNLKRAAEMIVSQYKGRFPEEYSAVRALPGIGDYTAAAICSICYNLPYPAVDGNVLRVVTRLLAWEQDIMLPETKRKTRELLLPLFQNGSCGELNQAFMELGALICIPNGVPLCSDCPLASVCLSRKEQLWHTIPVKRSKSPRKQLLRTVWILNCEDRYAVQKRPDSGLLAGLWEFPALDGEFSSQDALNQAAEWGCAPLELLRQADKKHIFTHIEWKMRGYYISCRTLSESFTWETAEEIRLRFSLPTAYRQFFEDT